MTGFLVVGMRGFEPPISRPPDAHFNRTKLHPELDCKSTFVDLIQQFFIGKKSSSSHILDFGF